MSDPTNQPIILQLEDALRLHQIDASIFAPFVIARLRSIPEDTDTEIVVRMKETNAQEERSLRVRLQWEAQSAFTQPVAVQERILTEWAALGVMGTVACAMWNTYHIGSGGRRTVRLSSQRRRHGIGTGNQRHYDGRRRRTTRTDASEDAATE